MELSEYNKKCIRECIDAHDRGEYAAAGEHLYGVFAWAHSPEGHDYWEAVQQKLEQGRARPVAIGILRTMLPDGKATSAKKIASKPSGPIPVKVASDELTEDRVASWLAGRGMTMIDTKELAALRRNGSGGPPLIDRETYKRMTRF